MVRTFLFEKELTYDGTQLSSLWGLKRFDIRGDSIIAFRGGCRVKNHELVDIEDFKAGDSIFSPDMLHFIIEHFDNDLEKAVLRQRLLVALTKDLLGERGLKHPVYRDGDDLFAAINGSLCKLSVSIATVTPVSTMIHFGINVNAEGAPVPAAGLVDLGLPGNEVFNLAREVLDGYAKEIEGVGIARCKVRGVL
ncbi:MAG TPA: DUF366 family protein [Desulfotomaculum sp.]|nr:DUF366 family protein [Desulfotomaculum sp.]